MPLSSIADCSASHWQDVRLILEDAISDAGYNPRVVSFGKEVSIIHERIVKNLYSDEIVVCDVSCKNPNVMFELGLRLAFDKPVIVVKDDLTDYSFDTSPIEHISYPRSLRFAQISTFKTELVSKIQDTVKAKKDNPDFSPFLSAFGPLKSAKMDTQEVSSQELLFDLLNKISGRIDGLEYSINGKRSDRHKDVSQDEEYKRNLVFRLAPDFGSMRQSMLVNFLMSHTGILNCTFSKAGSTTNVNVVYDSNVFKSERLVAVIVDNAIASAEAINKNT